MCHKIQNKIIYYCQSNNKLDFYFEFAKQYNIIDYILSINEMQRFIVEKVLFRLNNIFNSNCD